MKFNPSMYKLLFMARAADVICGEAAEWKAVQMNYHILYSTSPVSRPPRSLFLLWWPSKLRVSEYRHETGRLCWGKFCFRISSARSAQCSPSYEFPPPNDLRWQLL